MKWFGQVLGLSAKITRFFLCRVRNRRIIRKDISIYQVSIFDVDVVGVVFVLCIGPTTKYMTLGPKFYAKLVSAITRRRMNESQ